MSKKILIITGVILLVILVGAGGFWGGMTYKANQNSQAQASFFEQRGGSPSTGQFPSDGQFPEGMQFQGAGQGNFDQTQGIFRGSGTMGQVKSIEGDVLTISTAQDVTTVNLADNTTIIKSIEGSASDLQPGVRVMVAGEADDEGNITANQITILNNNPLAEPTRTAP